MADRTAESKTKITTNHNNLKQLNSRNKPCKTISVYIIKMAKERIFVSIVAEITLVEVELILIQDNLSLYNNKGSVSFEIEIDVKMAAKSCYIFYFIFYFINLICCLPLGLKWSVSDLVSDLVT